MNERLHKVLKNCQENRSPKLMSVYWLACQPIDLYSVKIKVKAKPKNPSQIFSVFFETNQIKFGEIKRGEDGWLAIPKIFNFRITNP